MRVVLCWVLAVCAIPAYAADEQEDLTEPEKTFVTSSVNLLGDCGGFFEFMSDIFKDGKQPATSQHMHEMANGARMAAAYLLYVEHNARGGKPKRLGDFMAYPEGRAGANKTRLTMWLEQNDKAALDAERERCMAAVPLQNELVQQIRNEAVGR